MAFADVLPGSYLKCVNKSLTSESAYVTPAYSVSHW
jgi:hypothetical protein